MGTITSSQRKPLAPYRPRCPENVDKNLWLKAAQYKTNPHRARFDNVTDTLPLADDPSPEQIADACAAIRETWGPAETKRRKIPADPLTTPLVAFADLIGAILGE